MRQKRSHATRKVVLGTSRRGDGNPCPGPLTCPPGRPFVKTTVLSGAIFLFRAGKIQRQGHAILDAFPYQIKRYKCPQEGSDFLLLHEVHQEPVTILEAIALPFSQDLLSVSAPL